MRRQRYHFSELSTSEYSFLCHALWNVIIFTIVYTQHINKYGSTVIYTVMYLSTCNLHKSFIAVGYTFLKATGSAGSVSI